jgi:hypothetical protein
VIAGVAMLLFAAVLIGVGMHHMISTGSCSSTGYSSVGPVPHCPKGFGWWIGFLVGGIFLALIGAAVSGSSALVIPAIFSGIGAGALSVNFDSSVHSDLRTFGLLFGGAFLLFGVIPGVFVLLGALRSSGAPSVAGSGIPIVPFVGATASPAAVFGGSAGVPGGPLTGGALSGIQPIATGAGTPSSGQALDEIAKLADLRDKGVLTDQEFARQKAKLLGEL